MAAYPSIVFEFKLNGTWYDVSNDVIDVAECEYGIFGNSPLDRVADVGELAFTLKNDASAKWGEKCYTPFSGNAVSGFGKGTNVRLKVTNSRNDTVVKFYGHISEIYMDLIQQRVNIKAFDYMDYLYNYPLNLSTIVGNKDISGVVQTILTGMAIQPLSTTYNTGQDTYTVAFDSINENTKAITEINKVALSEFGYVYVKRDVENGENLVVEGRNTRNFTNTQAKIPYDTDALLLETGFYFLQENGSSHILLNSWQSISYDSNMVDLNLLYGNLITNSISVKSYPRSISSASAVLFSLNNPIAISAGETLTNYVATFRDPTGGNAKISGSSMITPVATTDYQAFQNADGTGTNITASLSVTAAYGANGVNYTITNSSSTNGFITKLQARGYPIYMYDPVSYIASDSTSINLYGYQDLNIDQKYQSNPLVSQNIADAVLQQNKSPMNVVDSVTFIANTDDPLLTPLQEAAVNKLK